MVDRSAVSGLLEKERRFSPLRKGRRKGRKCRMFLLPEETCEVPTPSRSHEDSPTPAAMTGAAAVPVPTGKDEDRIAAGTAPPGLGSLRRPKPSLERMGDQAVRGYPQPGCISKVSAGKACLVSWVGGAI